jgi:hypothetical protein
MEKLRSLVSRLRQFRPNFKPDLSPKLKLWQAEAYRELGVEIQSFDHQKAIFPRWSSATSSMSITIG